MSEYQYYEFLAVDRPLATEEMSDLRSLSTRADITPVSFTNVYHWGDFRGDPHELMRRFFDAHVYVANWRTAIFMVRLPIEAMSQKIAAAAAVADVLDFDATDTHWVITWRLDESDSYDRFEGEHGPGWMARLAPVRDELLRGDYRSLYIAWLVAVTFEMVENDELEPLQVSGLGTLTMAQQALAEFLDVDWDLLEGAGIGSLATEEISPKEMDGWLSDLPRNEVHTLLKQLLEGQGSKAERSLKNRFSAWRRSLKGECEQAPRRTVEELKKNAETARKKRLERERIEQERLQAKRRKEREAYLANLAKNLPEAWKTAERHLSGSPGKYKYDEVCCIMVDMSEAYALHGNLGEFNRKLKQFMAGHMRRKALIERLIRAGIWTDR